MDLRKCHDLDPRLLVKGQGRYAHNGFKHSPGHKFSMKEWIEIFHRIVTLDPRKYHDLDPRSLVKGQGHYTHCVF
jgi:hypothetical protein